MGGDPVATAFYNALSATFPKGEAFFVESVRMFREGAPPKLAAEIKAFVTQEVMHSREHVQFNKRALEAGYDLSALEKRVEWRLSITRDRPPIVNLAATMCLEHFTAILAHQLLGNPRHLDAADPESAALWRWHAIEEIEHKGVAYDTWLHATRGLAALEALEDQGQGDAVRHPQFRRRPHARHARAAAPGRDHRRRAPGRGCSGSPGCGPGMLRKILGAWLAFFLPGFHPWNHDDRALIAKAESEYEAARLPVGADGLEPSPPNGRGAFTSRRHGTGLRLRVRFLRRPDPARTRGTAPPRRGRRCSAGRWRRSGGSRASQHPARGRIVDEMAGTEPLQPQRRRGHWRPAPRPASVAIAPAPTGAGRANSRARSRRRGVRPRPMPPIRRGAPSVRRKIRQAASRGPRSRVRKASASARL